MSIERHTDAGPEGREATSKNAGSRLTVPEGVLGTPQPSECLSTSRPLGGDGETDANCRQEVAKIKRYRVDRRVI